MPMTNTFQPWPRAWSMARTIDGVAARALGVAFGLAALVPSIGAWMVLGAVTANVPLPPGVDQYIESMIPVLQPAVPGATDTILPLWALLVATLFLIGFSLLGLFQILSALLKPDYTLTVRGGSPRVGGRP